MRLAALCILASFAAPSLSPAQSTVTAAVALAGVNSGPSADSAALRSDTAGTRRDSSIHRLDAVIVKGDAGSGSAYSPAVTSSALKTPTLLRDTPQAVTVIGRQLIADQGMRTMGDAVRYAPGITMGQGEGHRDAPTIRGNSSTADFFVDGTRDDAQYLRDLYNVDRVEALNGPNAMTFGRGGGGGVINRVSKTADWREVGRLELEGGSWGGRRLAVDGGRPFGSALAGRANGMYENSDRFRDHTSLERYGINPTLSAMAGSTLVRVGYERFNDERTVDRGIPSFEGRPSAAGITTFFGDPAASISRLRLDGATAAVERAFAGGLSIRSTTRIASYDKFYQNVYPGAVNAAGTHVALHAYRHSTNRENLFSQADLTLPVVTGSVRHTLLIGAEVGRQITRNVRETGYFDDQTATTSVPFGAPTVAPSVTYRTRGSDADNRAVADIGSIYLQDQIAFAGPFEAVLGLRYDRLAVRAHDNRTDRDVERTDGVLSPRVGLVARLAPSLSLYSSYSLSHLPSAGDQLSSLTPTTKTLEPERFENRELGVKWDALPSLQLTLAAYRLDRTNTAAPDPGDASVLVPTGAQRTEGVEIGVAGDVTGSWSVAAGFASQRAVITSRTSAAKEGATVPLVPRTTLSWWNRYQMTNSLGAGAGVIHQTDMFAAVDNAVTLPGFTRIDAALYVAVRPGLQAQVNVENLFDARYYGTSHGNNNIMPGSPRSLRLTLTAGR
jgi:catecholate siderophore receptor